MIFLFDCRYLTECYDELGTQYKVPIYCLSYPINIVKEDNGRDSPAEYSEPVDGGTEVVLKLRLSSSFADTKLTVYSKDTIGQCKKKLQVSVRQGRLQNERITFARMSIQRLSFFFLFYFRHKRVWMHAVNAGFTVANCWAIRFWSKTHKSSHSTLYRSL